VSPSGASTLSCPGGSRQRTCPWAHAQCACCFLNKQPHAVRMCLQRMFYAAPGFRSSTLSCAYCVAWSRRKRGEYVLPSALLSAAFAALRNKHYAHCCMRLCVQLIVIPAWQSLNMFQSCCQTLMEGMHRQLRISYPVLVCLSCLACRVSKAAVCVV
jgi:hypothetical protein